MVPVISARSQQISEGGFTWRQSGEGAAVLLIHGIGGSSRSWDPLMQRLPDRCAIAWDMPGYGGSEPLPSPMPRAEEYAASALRFMDARGLRWVDVVAHSLGAIVVAAMCGRSPDRIGRVVLACPVLGLGALPAQERELIRERRISEIRELGMRRFAEERVGGIAGPAIRPQDRDECIAVMAEVPSAAYVQAWHMLCEEDLTNMLEGLALRPTIIACTHDAAAPFDSVQRLHSRVGGELVTFEGAGHFPMLETADAFASAVRSTLER